MFLSLKWKALLAVLTMLTTLCALLIYLNAYYLENFALQERQRNFLMLRNQLYGLLVQSYNRNLQLIDLIPSFMNDNDSSPDAVAAMLDRNWSNLEFNWGLEGATVYNASGDLVWQSPSQADTPEPSLSLQHQWRIECQELCRQVIIAPVIFDELTYAVKLEVSMADLLIDFSRIAGANVGILVPTPSDGNAVTLLPKWQQTVKLLTMPEQTSAVLNTLANQSSFQQALNSVLSTTHGGDSFDVIVTNIRRIKHESRTDANIRFVMVLNTSASTAFTGEATQLHITTAVSGVSLIALLLLLLLLRAITRLTHQSRVLPLLTSGELDRAMKELKKTRSNQFFRDELDTLNDTEERVCQQLADMSTDIEKKSTRLQNLAMYDSLTGLANRRSLLEYVDDTIANRDLQAAPFSLFFIDLDNFKRINDSMGHNIGDELLRVVAQRLLACVRKHDFIARLGGDEFCVVLNSQSRVEDQESVANHILEQLRKPIKLLSNELIVSASIGIVTAPTHGRSTADLLQNADLAMYRAKALGRNKYQRFDEQMSDEAIESVYLESELRLALLRDEYVLYYQPQICLHSGEIAGFEALLRWQHPDKGLVFPDKFIPILEDTGLIVQVGEWIINEACRQLREWISAGCAPVNIAVNLSPRQLQYNDLVGQVEEALHFHKIDPSYLELEVTESLIMEDVQFTRQLLSTLKALGVMASIDDFGTGYSSLSYLRDLPLKKLKIDRSFISSLDSSSGNKNIVDAIILVAKKLDLEIVAEGIENPEQEQFLRQHTCTYGQGYLYSRPIPPDEAYTMLRQHKLQQQLVEAVS